jgi:poly-beta-1,6-N-acetyl-D-glucosamine synthase
MKAIFYISLLLIFYPYFIYPAILWMLSFLFEKKIKKENIYPPVSLIISVYNEEKLIEEKIINSLAIDYPKEKLEIIIASESNDKTDEIVRKYKNRGIKLYKFSNREGKAATLYRVVPEAKGEIIVFSDANAIYKKDAIQKLINNFSDERIGCVSGRMCYEKSEGDVSGGGEIAYWNYYEFFIKKISSRLLSLSGGVSGSIFALRKKAYFPLNRYRGDDFELSINAAINGYGVILEAEAISLEKASETLGKEFKRKVRMISWNFKSACLLLTEALRRSRIFISFQILSHKIVRWLAPFFIITFFISSMFLIKEGMFFKIFFLAQVLFYSVSLFGLFFQESKLKLLLLPSYFCMVNYAAILGVFASIFKKDEILWEKSR